MATLKNAKDEDLLTEMERRGWEWMFTKLRGGGLQVLVLVEKGYERPKPEPKTPKKRKRA